MTAAELAAQAMRQHGISAQATGETLIIYGAASVEQRDLCEKIWRWAQEMTGWRDLKVAEGL